MQTNRDYRKTRAGSLRVWATLVCVSLVSACAITGESTTEYYLLNSTSESTSAVQLAPFRLGLGPVELADYLAQEGIAMHRGNNQIDYASNRRWAEPLDRNISQVLLSNLSALLPNQIVYPFPWKVSQSPDYQFIININRFGWFPDNRVAMNARVLLEDQDGKIVFSGEENLEAAAPGTDYQSNVAAQSRLLRQFSERLVAILQQVVPQ